MPGTNDPLPSPSGDRPRARLSSDDLVRAPRACRDVAAMAQRDQALYETFCAGLRELGVPVETGVFGARMRLELTNDGPVMVGLEN